MRFVVETTRSDFSWMFPSRENGTIAIIKAKHRVEGDGQSPMQGRREEGEEDVVDTEIQEDKELPHLQVTTELLDDKRNTLARKIDEQTNPRSPQETETEAEAEDRRLDKVSQLPEGGKPVPVRTGIAKEIRERIEKRAQRGKEIHGPKQTSHGPGEKISQILLPSLEELQSSMEKIQYSVEYFAFAVTGASGTGKSSLINIFLNLPDTHKDAARTGLVETTSTLGRYPDPSDQSPYKWNVWYDVPGAGTTDIPWPHYFIEESLFIFDLILVVFDNRFTQIDVDILRNCQLLGIPSFIIRSKADSHIKNHMKSKGYESEDDMEDVENLRRGSRDHFITTTRQNVKRELEKAGLPPQKVYIVSCSKQFRREYSAFTSGLVLSTGEASRGRFVDEMELIHDLMLTAATRRCEITPKVLCILVSI